MPAAIHSTLANWPTSRNRRRRPGCGAAGSHTRDSAAHPPIEPIGDLQAIGFGDGCGGLPAGVFTGKRHEQPQGIGAGLELFGSRFGGGLVSHNEVELHDQGLGPKPEGVIVCHARPRRRRRRRKV